DDEARCFRENAEGAEVLARACARVDVPFVTFSSDLVFDGEDDAPYVESAPRSPLGVYGRSKALAEERVLAAHEGALVVRTSAFFGPWDLHDFVARTLDSLGRGEQPSAAGDAVVSPTYV